jgi:hypothetical protein
MKKETVLEQKRKRKVYCFVLSEIINGLNKLKEEYKVDYNINAKESWFILELSNGDKMTYISLDIFTIKEKIKSYLIKKYKIEMKNFDIALLKAEDEFSKATDEEVLSYLSKKNTNKQGD